MKISYNWIKDYLKIDLEPEKVAEILTGIGLEIEGMGEWVSVKGGMEGVVIGEILTCKKHPDADKLSVTTVDIGASQPLQIVCGAPNVAAGQKVPVATAGTVVFKGEESLEIKKSRIRGEISEGIGVARFLAQRAARPARSGAAGWASRHGEARMAARPCKRIHAGANPVVGFGN